MEGFGAFMVAASAVAFATVTETVAEETPAALKVEPTLLSVTEAVPAT